MLFVRHLNQGVICWSFMSEDLMQGDFEITDDGEFAVVEGVQLHYVSRGAGAPVVLLHGNAGFTHDYAAVVRSLVEHGFRALAFDRPGHGQSVRPNNGTATVEKQARLIRGALGELNIKRPIMIGHSWGGMLVLAYALEYKMEVSGIVLLAPAAYPDDSEFATPRALIEIPGLGDLIIRMSSPLIDREIRRNLDRAFSPDEVPAYYLELATAIWNRPEQIKAIVQDEAIFSTTAERLSRRYSEIQVPTIIITGDSDRLVNPEKHAYPLHDVISQSRLIVLPETGHMLPHTRPEAVLDAVQILEAQLS